MRPWRLAGPPSGIRAGRSGDGVSHLDRVADRVEGRVARAEMLIDLDAAGDADREPRGFLRELRFGSDPETEDHQIGREAGSVRENHD